MDKFPEDWIVDKLEEIYAETADYQNRKGCLYWMGYKQATNKKNSVIYGFKCIKYPGDDKCHKVTVHRLRYILHLGFKPDINMDVSHLCHNSLCLNVDHLSLEPKSVNKSRSKCLNKEICSTHPGYANCII